MATFSFDIVSDYDKAEVNNVFMQAQREISNRYDFKGTPAAVEWLDDKRGFVVTAGNDMQLQSIIDILRRTVINRGQSPKLLDLDREPVTTNLTIVQEIPFVSGLDTDKAKSVTKLIREAHPKAKPAIQGDAVRVTSASKDELQKVMATVTSHAFDFPVGFTNFR